MRIFYKNLWFSFLLYIIYYTYIDYTLKGATGLSRRFTLVFTSHDKDTAARRAKKFHQSLRGNDGTWEQVTVTRPSGGEETVYISPDKRYSTIQRELGCKTLAAVLKEHDDSVTFKIVRKEFAIVTSDWAVLATIEYKHENKSTHINWKTAGTEMFGSRTTQLEERYASRNMQRKARG